MLQLGEEFGPFDLKKRIVENMQNLINIHYSIKALARASLVLQLESFYELVS
jgi:hypothetical protein